MSFVLLSLLMLPSQAAVETIPQLGATAPAAKPGLSLADVAQVVPVGTYKADVVEVAFPDWFTSISTKLQAGMAANPAKAQAAMQAMNPGQPLPYADWMGVTKEEYDRLVAANQAGNIAYLKTIDTIDLTVARAGNQLTITGKTGTPMARLTLDLGTDRAIFQPFANLITLGKPQSAFVKDAVAGPTAMRSWHYALPNVKPFPANETEAKQRLDTIRALAAQPAMTTVNASCVVGKVADTSPTNAGRVMLTIDSFAVGNNRQGGANYSVLLRKD